MSHRGCDPVLPPGEPVLIGPLSMSQNLHFLHGTLVQLDSQTERDLVWCLWRIWICSTSLNRFRSALFLFFSSVRLRSHNRNLVVSILVILDFPSVCPTLRGVFSSRPGSGSGFGSCSVSWCLGLDGRMISDLRDDSFLGPTRVDCGRGGLVCVLVLHFHVVYIRNRTERSGFLNNKTIRTLY